MTKPFLSIERLTQRFPDAAGRTGGGGGTAHAARPRSAIGLSVAGAPAPARTTP